MRIRYGIALPLSFKNLITLLRRGIPPLPLILVHFMEAKAEANVTVLVRSLLQGQGLLVNGYRLVVFFEVL